MGLKEPNLNLSEIMDELMILLVNLAENGDYFSNINAKLFGALLVNEFFQLAKQRKKDEWGKPPRPFYLYIDEFQNFVTPDIGSILAQSLKFGLNVILAHQSLGQIENRDKELIDTVLTNAKIRAVFGGMTREYAKLLVGEMFVNQLDLREIKKAIYQTKFWPTYGRDKVYSSSHTDGASSSTASSLGGAVHQIEGEGWFGTSSVISTTASQADVSSDGKIHADTSGEIDIPIFIPVPYQELASLEYWKLDEQIWRMSDALKEQFQRHCFIKIMNQKTQPMLVPLIKQFYVEQEELLQFENDLYKSIKAISREKVDQILNEQKEELKMLAKKQIPYPTKFRE